MRKKQQGSKGNLPPCLPAYLLLVKRLTMTSKTTAPIRATTKPTSDVGFIFKKQIGQTRLLVDDGETAVIGGLTLSEVTRSVTGIPGLMNVPLLGALFRTTKEQESKTDLIILVTPHIVFPDDLRAME